MNNQQLSETFSELSTPLIADACLRLKIPFRLAPAQRAEEIFSAAQRLWERERQQAREIRSGKTLREHLQFDGYLARRSTDKAHTFRRHLRGIGGAIEE